MTERTPDRNIDEAYRKYHKQFLHKLHKMAGGHQRIFDIDHETLLSEYSLSLYKVLRAAHDINNARRVEQLLWNNLTWACKNLKTQNIRRHPLRYIVRSDAAAVPDANKTGAGAKLSAQRFSLGVPGDSPCTCCQKHDDCTNNNGTGACINKKAWKTYRQFTNVCVNINRYHGAVAHDRPATSADSAEFINMLMRKYKRYRGTLKIIWCRVQDGPCNDTLTKMRSSIVKTLCVQHGWSRWGAYQHLHRLAKLMRRGNYENP